MTKFSISVRILIATALTVSLCHGQSSVEGAPAELQQLPMVALDRKGEFSAEFIEMPGAGEGLRKYGFAFRTPPLIEGPATWLVVWDHEKPDDASWEVTFADGKTLAVVSPALDDLRLYPELTEKFPAGKSVQRLRVEQHRLNKWDRYQAVLTTPAKTPPLGIIINAAAEGIVKKEGGEVREVKIPEGWIPSPMVMELLENIRAVKGDAAAIEFLEAQFTQKAERTSEFEVLFSKVWDEAQFGTGSDNPAWGSRLNDAAFTSAIKIGHYSRAFDIMNNLCVSLGGAARFGRLAEVHAILEDSYRKGGMNMDPSVYPDLGSAIACLPSVRRRDITIVTPYSKELPPGPPPISRVQGFDAKQASALLSYANQRINRGDWQGGLEWTVWVRDWASDETGNPKQPRNEEWYSATFQIAIQLEFMGYTEEALALVETAVAAPYGRNYRQRNKITASRLQLDLKRAAGQPDPETIPKLRALIVQIGDHIHFGRSSVWIAKINLANALFEVEQFEEGDRIIEEIIQEGSYSARWTRLGRWLDTGRTEGVEAELIAMLKSSRESGHKISELGLYSRYADFLESTGRFQEALAMRREAIRLARDFNGFTRLPVQLAKLAELLHKLGHADLAALAADEARSLLKAWNMPKSTIESVTKSLSGIDAAAPALAQNPKAQQPDIDLQPHRGLVIPLEGAPWTSYLTLTNPGSVAVRGTLDISGPALTAKVDDETGNIWVELGKAGETSLALTITPASYRLITVAADSEDASDGELKFNWRSLGGEMGDEAKITIDKREEGVAGAIIQAGQYQANPFYGVPIQLSYVAKDQRTKSSPLRFTASQVARIEIYRLDGTPLAVDGTGNGSLLDPGDQVFTETDGAGNLLLGLIDGGAALRVLAYPQGKIGEDGLKIDVEAFNGSEWSLHSSNRIEP